MTRLTDYTTYADAHRHFSSSALWSLFDGDRVTRVETFDADQRDQALARFEELNRSR